ncbi:Presenilin-1 [Gonapodya sp. JEL0774]|nr:Presenilin-1 [Gonapodya sp. JEL0774]
MHQMYSILKPVAACIILSVVWVKVVRGGGDDGGERGVPIMSTAKRKYVDDGSKGIERRMSARPMDLSDLAFIALAHRNSSQLTRWLSYAPVAYQYVGGNTDDRTTPSSQELFDAAANALIILSQIIVATFIIMALFYYNFMRVLSGFFVFVVLTLLWLNGYALMAGICYKLNTSLDLPSAVFMIWNLAIGGVLVIFWKGPLWVQQWYLVFMSSLMAFSFTGMAEWTTWILLGFLAVWDLFAVLSPYGPLRILVESSRSQNRDVPGLLYTAMVWIMASEPAAFVPVTLPSKVSDSVPTPDVNRIPPIKSPSGLLGGSRAALWSEYSKNLRSSERGIPLALLATKDDNRLAHVQDSYHATESHEDENEDEDTHGVLPDDELIAEGTALLNAQEHGDSQGRYSVDIEYGRLERRRYSVGLVTPDAMREQRHTQMEHDQEAEEEDERSGLKLGLGDFVFYSVMVSRAAVTGLTMTIFLLAIFRKALPALPISIALGLMFYFATRVLVIPFLEGLVGWHVVDDSHSWEALKVGKAVGMVVLCSTAAYFNTPGLFLDPATLQLDATTGTQDCPFSTVDVMELKKLRVEYWDGIKIVILRENTLPQSYQEFIALLYGKIPPLESAASRYGLRMRYREYTDVRPIGFALESDDDLEAMYQSGESFIITVELEEPESEDLHNNASLIRDDELNVSEYLRRKLDALLLKFIAISFIGAIAEWVVVALAGREYAFPIVWNNTVKHGTEEAMSVLGKAEWAAQRSWGYKQISYSDTDLSIIYGPRESSFSKLKGATRYTFAALSKYPRKLETLGLADFKSFLIDPVSRIAKEDVVTEWAIIQPPSALQTESAFTGKEYHCCYLIKDSKSQLSEVTRRRLEKWIVKALGEQGYWRGR